MSHRAFVVLGLAALLAPFASGAVEFAYKLYPGPARPQTELAIVRMGDAHLAWFNGRPASSKDWVEVQLLPGEHVIRWKIREVDTGWDTPVGFPIRAVLEAGHVYTLRADPRLFRSDPPPERSELFWVEDLGTREVGANELQP